MGDVQGPETGEQHFLTAGATRDQEQLDLRKSEHLESQLLPQQLAYVAARASKVIDKVTYKQLQEHFHLPLAEVAKKFGMCTTAFKKLCRRHGIMSWPHRALRSIEKKIASIRAEANFTNKQDWKEEQVFKLQTKRASILAGIGLPSGWEDAVDESSSNSRSLLPDTSLRCIGCAQIQHVSGVRNMQLNAHTLCKKHMRDGVLTLDST